MSFDGYWPCLCTHNDGRDRVLHPPYEERCAACQVIRPAPEEGEELAPTPPPHATRAIVRGRIFECITLERTLQDEKWGADRDLSTPWAAVLMEEAGEVARAHLEAKHHPSGHRAGLAHLKTELVQLAAVAVAWIEAVHVEDERAGRGYDSPQPLIAQGPFMTRGGVILHREDCECERCRPGEP